MRKTLALAAAALLAVGAASTAWAMKNVIQMDAWEELLQHDVLGEEGPVAAHSDTVWFGGSGTGNGSIVRGGTWDWEANSGETPLTFPDGDPVGNQFRDGFTFNDRTTRNGPSQEGPGHWSPTGVYNFNDDNGAYAHRATTHPNNGVNDGPGPLVGSWSIWIGTNLFLNPENCGWGQTRGYGDGWSAGIKKSFAVPAGSQGTLYTVQFFHRFAVEAGFDTNFVEASYNGEDWFFVDNSGIYNGGVAAAPVGPAQAVANLGIIPFNTAGTLHVRFRLVADAFFSDNNEAGDFLYAWQLDSIQLFRGANPEGDLSTFEGGLDGWELRRFEGKDVALTNSLTLPAGRIESVSNVACPPIAPCAGTCADNNILLFTDRDICGLNDSFQDSYATSKAFAIGGPANPDLDGDSGRLVRLSVYLDGGAAGAFETGLGVCWTYFPFNAEHCPYTPPGGDPGAGTTFNWSQTDFGTCLLFGQAAGPLCAETANVNISATLPASADSVILHMGAISQCRSFPACDPDDNGAPFIDNLRLGVFNPGGVALATASIDRYSDSFPTEEGSFLTRTARMDGAHSFSMNLMDVPSRWVRADTAVTETGAANLKVNLRFRVTPGACQPNLNHAFFTAYPPNQWHSARMDTGRAQGTGNNQPGAYMTCFHEADPREGTHWTGAPPAVEPCDDILPDGLFTAGTKVHYFFEARDATTNALRGTTPSARNAQPIGTTENWSSFWLESTVLPDLDPSCDGSQTHNLLLVNDSQSAVLRSRLSDVLSSLGLEFEIYDSEGANFFGSYNGIGRREDRPGQAPRPPINGATDSQIEGYDCIWYFSGVFDFNTLSDETDPNPVGGHPSNDQQRLETWITGCLGAGENRLLVLEGTGWAADVEGTANGPTFLGNRGVNVLTSDYAQMLANDDLRRCARVVGQGTAGAGLTGELFGSGCPDDFDYQVLQVQGGGATAVMNYVESGEAEPDPITCGNDVNQPTWHAVIRNTDPVNNCERSVSMSFPFTLLYPLNCTDECLFDDFIINGDNAELVIREFQAAGKPINANPIGVEDPAGAPRLVNALYQAEPNPANPSARIRYSIQDKGRVRLRIFDVSGRLVRTLVEEVKEAAAEGHEAVWDGTNDAGQRVGSGVFFYQIEAPNFTSAKKLVILK